MRVRSERASVAALEWPKGQSRTPAHQRKSAKFRVSAQDAANDLIKELELMGARYVTISWDVDGRDSRGGVWQSYKSLPYNDPGVAVYFDLDTDQMCIAIDIWDNPIDNLRAIGLSVNAMRGLERWGSPEMMRRSFEGFRHALPAAGSDWKAIFDLQGDVTLEDVKKKHRQLALAAHPDHGGNEHEMSRLNQALEAAKDELT